MKLRRVGIALTPRLQVSVAALASPSLLMLFLPPPCAEHIFAGLGRLDGSCFKMKFGGRVLVPYSQLYMYNLCIGTRTLV